MNHARGFWRTEITVLVTMLIAMIPLGMMDDADFIDRDTAQKQKLERKALEEIARRAIADGAARVARQHVAEQNRRPPLSIPCSQWVRHGSDTPICLPDPVVRPR